MKVSHCAVAARREAEQFPARFASRFSKRRSGKLSLLLCHFANSLGNLTQHTRERLQALQRTQADLLVQFEKEMAVLQESLQQRQSDLEAERKKAEALYKRLRAEEHERYDLKRDADALRQQLQKTEAEFVKSQMQVKNTYFGLYCSRYLLIVSQAQRAETELRDMLEQVRTLLLVSSVLGEEEQESAGEYHRSRNAQHTHTE